MSMLLIRLALAAALLPQVVSAQAHHVTEREPNDTAALATRIALGDSVSGDISSTTDRDFFVIDLPAGITLRMIRPVGNVRYTLYDTDGLTRLAVLSPAWTVDHPDSSYFAFPITRSGTYFIRASAASPEAYDWITGPYALQTWGEPLPLGPGDPLTSVADIPELSTGAAVRMIAGSQGEIFVELHDPSSYWPNVEVRILRIRPDGSRSWISPGLEFSGGFALDALGDLLVSGTEPNDSANHIWRVHPRDGTKERIAANLGPFRHDAGRGDGFHIAVAPDGDFWAGDVDTLRHFDLWGRLLGTVPLPQEASWMFSLAVSPTGVPHFASHPRGIYRVTRGGTVERVVADSVGELAFDQDGNLYIGAWEVWAPGWGHVLRYDAAYHYDGRLAIVPYLDGLTFARDERGEMTSRLLTIQDAFIHELLALADGAAHIPGSGVRLIENPPISVQQITDALMGGAPLDPAVASYLDRNGNANGKLDVGDLRAWLRAQGQLLSPR